MSKPSTKVQYLLLPFFILLFAYAQDGIPNDIRDFEGEATRRVRAILAEKGVLSTTRNTSVTIEPAQESIVGVGSAGFVADILYREGAHIEEDTIVVQIDDKDLKLALEDAHIALESARVDLLSAERSSKENQNQTNTQTRLTQTNLQLAQNEYREGQVLYEAGGIAANELSRLKAALEDAELSHQQAQDNAAQAGRVGSEDLALLRLQVQSAQNSLAQAQKDLDDAKVIAPFTGEIAEMFVEQGEYLGVGDQVFRLVSSENQLAKFSVPPEDADNLVEQGLIWIDYEDLDYSAQIQRFNSVPGASRLVEITAQLYKSKERIPTGTITLLKYDLILGEGISLPNGAVQTSEGQDFVFVVENDIAKKQIVTTIAEAAGEVIVEGIEEDTLIVFPVPSDLADETPLEIVGIGIPE